MPVKDVIFLDKYVQFQIKEGTPFGMPDNYYVAEVPYAHSHRLNRFTLKEFSMAILMYYDQSQRKDTPPSQTFRFFGFLKEKRR